jgi:hypothetical protein
LQGIEFLENRHSMHLTAPNKISIFLNAYLSRTGRYYADQAAAKVTTYYPDN